MIILNGINCVFNHLGQMEKVVVNEKCAFKVSFVGPVGVDVPVEYPMWAYKRLNRELWI